MLHPEFYKLAGRPWGLHRGKTEDSKEKIRSSWSKRAPLSFTLSGLFTKWRFYQIEGATQKHPSQLPVENNFSGSKSISFFFRTELDVLVTNDLHQLEDTECKKKKSLSSADRQWRRLCSRSAISHHYFESFKCSDEMHYSCLPDSANYRVQVNPKSFSIIYNKQELD